MKDRETLFDPEHLKFPEERDFARFVTRSGIARMREAVEIGRTFARRFPPVTGKAEEMELHTRIRRDCEAQLAAFLERAEFDTCVRLLRIAFCIGASVEFQTPELYGFPGPGTCVCEVHAQRDIAILMRTLSLPDIYALRRSGEDFGIPSETWFPMLAGGTGVATFVEAVQRAGHVAFLPTVKEDSRDGIDVLVPFAMYGLCVQVRRDREIKGIQLTRIVRKPFGPGGSDHSLMRRVWIGTQKFNKRYGVSWFPAFVKVAPSNNDDLVLGLSEEKSPYAMAL